VDKVQAEAARRGALTIDRVHVRIGEMSGVDRDLLATAYLIYRERTMCERAPLEITAIPASWVCRECGAAVRPGGPLQCRECGAPAVLQQGDEIVLDRIEMEVA
jgi:hydrogenase nickel incorporation protein HypA/HybF